MEKGKSNVATYNVKLSIETSTQHANDRSIIHPIDSGLLEPTQKDPYQSQV